MENLRGLQAAPSVAFQERPPDWAVREAEEELRSLGGSMDPDLRPGAVGSDHTSGRAPGMLAGVGGMDGHREHDAEFYDGERDQDRDRAGAEPAAGSGSGGSGDAGAGAGAAGPPPASAEAAASAVASAVASEGGGGEEGGGGPGGEGPSAPEAERERGTG